MIILLFITLFIGALTGVINHQWDGDVNYYKSNTWHPCKMENPFL